MRYADGGGLSGRGRERRERVRMQAAQMFGRGVRPSQVAGVLRVSVKSACAWHRAWQAGGAAALVSKGPAGQSCRLSTEQLQRLESELEAGPTAHGWADQRWTLDRVAELIDKLFGVGYTERGTSLLLHRLGWSPQVSAHRAAERDEGAIASWARQTWPQIKGRRRPGTGGSASKTRPAGS
jgi:putative transposase